MKITTKLEVRRESREQQLKMLQLYVAQARDWLWEAVTYTRERQEEEIILEEGLTMSLEEGELFLVRLMLAMRTNSLLLAKWELRNIPAKLILLEKSVFRDLREAWNNTCWICG